MNKYFDGPHISFKWQKIVSVLQNISLNKLSASELQQALNFFKSMSQKKAYSFEFLMKYGLDVLPFAAKVVLCPISQIPFFTAQKSMVHTFTKGQIIYLYCLMVLCLVPKASNNYGSVRDFSVIFSSEKMKTMAVVQYLREVQRQGFIPADTNRSYDNKTQQQAHQKLNNGVRNQKLQIIRSIAQQPFAIQNISTLDDKMSTVIMEANQADIEYFIGDLKVDFANKYIGGGALFSGCVQEELMFVDHPQMYVAVVLCEVMASNQSLVFTGFKKYFSHSGYGFDAQFIGKANIKYSYKNNIAQEFIVAIDAINFKTQQNQLSIKAIQRQLKKAYIGFSAFDRQLQNNLAGTKTNVNNTGNKTLNTIQQSIKKQREINQIDSSQTNLKIQKKEFKQQNVKQKGFQIVTTGNWGCGAFRGNVRIKFLLQWIAASLAKKALRYCPYGRLKDVYDLKLINKMQNKTIRQNYQTILQAAKRCQHSNQIYEVLKSHL